MRLYGHNPVAILIAAIAIYLVGFVIFGILVDPWSWMSNAGVSQAAIEAVGTSRMPYGVLMPLVTAIGIAALVRWTGANTLSAGLRLGAVVALASAIPHAWYEWVYGVGGVVMPLVDSVHLLIGHMAAGAIIATSR